MKFNIEVVSISRTGIPSGFEEDGDVKLKGSVKWHKGDIFKEDEWKDQLKDCDGVISCVGAFGTNEVGHYSKTLLRLLHTFRTVYGTYQWRCKHQRNSSRKGDE